MAVAPPLAPLATPLVQHPTTRAYTWHDIGKTVECRLDIFYVSGPSVKEWVVEGVIHSCHFSDHDAFVLVINDTMNSPSVRSGVWKLNMKSEILKSDVLACKLQRFWKYWQHQKASFPTLEEWWDAGKVELKDGVQQHSRQVRKTEREYRASIANRYRRLATKPNLSSSEVQELTELRSRYSVSTSNAWKDAMSVAEPRKCKMGKNHLVTSFSGSMFVAKRKLLKF